MAVTLVVCGSIYALLSGGQSAFRRQPELTTRQQNIRLAMDLIQKDLSTEVGRESLQLIRKHGMLSETSFVLGFPHETEESIKATLALAKHYDPDMAHFLCITPWPYADMWEEMKDRVRVTDYAKYNLIEPIVEPHAMTLEELDLAISRCYRDFYMPKMASFMSFPDEFRRHYMKSSMMLIMKSSLLKPPNPPLLKWWKLKGYPFSSSIPHRNLQIGHRFAEYFTAPILHPLRTNQNKKPHLPNNDSFGSSASPHINTPLSLLSLTTQVCRNRLLNKIIAKMPC